MSLDMTQSRPRTGRPSPGEYAEYAAADIAAVAGDDATEALVRLAEETPAMFRTLAAAAERGLAYGPGKWTLKGILGHIVDDERIFSYRLLCVARGEDRELPGFDENRYAAHAEFERHLLEDLLSEYTATRAATLALLRGLPLAAWARSCQRLWLFRTRTRVSYRRSRASPSPHCPRTLCAAPRSTLTPSFAVAYPSGLRPPLGRRRYCEATSRLSKPSAPP